VSVANPPLFQFFTLTMQALLLRNSVFSNTKRLSVIASVPFVNADWRTDIFDVDYWLSSGRKVHFTGEVKNRLEHLNISTHIRAFLGRLASIADELESIMDSNQCLCDELGLGQVTPQDGYPKGSNIKTFFYPFMCCIVLDRCLWAVIPGSTSRTTQWIHPRSDKLGVLSLPKVRPYEVGGHVIRDFLISWGSRGEVNVSKDGNPILEMIAQMCINAATHKGDADVSRAMSNLNYLTSVCYALSVVRIHQFQ
jgi:hypothetical protein